MGLIILIQGFVVFLNLFQALMSFLDFLFGLVSFLFLLGQGDFDNIKSLLILFKDKVSFGQAKFMFFFFDTKLAKPF